MLPDGAFSEANVHRFGNYKQKNCQLFAAMLGSYLLFEVIDIMRQLD
jgi:hypothetical protein